MLTLAALASAVLVAGCLALAMPRHHRQCTGREPSGRVQLVLRVLALVAGLISIRSAVLAWGGVLGPVAVFGVFTAAAGAIVFCLPLVERRRTSARSG